MRLTVSEHSSTLLSWWNTEGRDDKGMKQKIYQVGIAWHLIIVLILALCLVSISSSPVVALSVDDYFSYSYDIELGKTEIHRSEVFYATIKGTATCKKNLPLTVSKAHIISRVIAEHQVTGARVMLNSNYTVAIDPFPSKEGEIVQSSEVIPLQFPAQGESGDYSVIGELIEAKVRIRVGWVWIWQDVTSYFPQAQVMGSVSYIALEEEPPTIAFSPSSLSFSTPKSSNPANKTLSIWNSSSGTLDWSVSDDATWLSLNPTSGSSTAEVISITLLVSTSGMDTGSYSATITISAPGATNTPQTVPVNLRIFMRPSTDSISGKDTTPPIISDVKASTITTSSVIITWTTNERSDSQLEYRTGLSELTPLDETLVFEHLVHLTDLTPATTYHFKVMSSDEVGNRAVSGEYTFATLQPATFAISDLSVAPDEVGTGESVTISAPITNTGDLTGTYEVTLKIDEVVVATKEVTLAGGASERVTFTTSKDVAGTYAVTVDGLSDTFIVKAPPVIIPPKPINWWLIGGIIAACIIIISVVIWLAVRPRRA